MLKNLDESRDRRCLVTIKISTAAMMAQFEGHNSSRSDCGNYSRVARQSLMVTCHVVFGVRAWHTPTAVVRQDEVPRGPVLGVRYMSQEVRASTADRKHRSGNTQGSLSEAAVEFEWTPLTAMISRSKCPSSSYTIQYHRRRPHNIYLCPITNIFCAL